jgi:hypothetical protein
MTVRQTHQTHPGPDPAPKAEAAVLRDLLREAHGTVNYLRQAIADAHQLAGRLAGEAARETASRIADASAAKHEPPVPAFPAARLCCPDCTASMKLGGTLVHDDECPLGLATDGLAGPDGSDAR